MFISPASRPMLQDGKLRALAVTPASYAARCKAEYELYRELLPEIGLKPQ